jgi:hypothetical protein
VWSNTSPSREKKHKMHFQSALTFSCNLFPRRSRGSTFCTFMFQFLIIWVHPRLIHSQNARKECLSLPVPSLTMCSGQQCTRWSFRMRGIHFNQTLSFPSSCSENAKHVRWGYSNLCPNRCIHHVAVVLDHGMNTLHASSVSVSGAWMRGAFLHPPAHHEWGSSTSEQFHMMGHKCPALHSKDPDTFSRFSSKQEMKLYHSANVPRRATCLRWFSVHYSAESGEAMKQRRHIIPQGQHCYHTVLRSITRIGCQVARPYRKLDITWSVQIHKIKM